MKKNSILLMAFLLSAFTATASPVSDSIATPADDKQSLLDYFDETAERLLNSIDGLSQAQMEFRAAEDQWSAAQCLEHIILTDKALFEAAKGLIEQPANPEKRSEIKATDEQIISMINDRSQKAQAQGSMKPSGTYKNTAEAVAAFKSQRELVTSYIRNTPENLRDHVMTDAPGGPADAHQFLLFMAGHCSRHTQQIEEIKANPNFPSGE